MSKNRSILGSILALVILFLSSQGYSTDVQNDKLVAFKLIVNYPIVIKRSDTVHLSNFNDTLLIVHYKDLTLYKLVPLRILKTDAKISGTEQYFVRKDSALFGKLFERLTDTAYRLVAVDSFLEKRAFSTANFENSKNDRLVKTIIHRGIVEERYVPMKKTVELMFDSTIYYYSVALNNIPYTFSPKLDRLKKAKLFKVRLIYNKSYSKTYQVDLPKREYLFELQNAKIDNPDALLRLLKII